MEKKFFLCWINDPDISHDYYEIWGHSDLLEDFKHDNEFMKEANNLKLGKSFIHFVDGSMIVVTRVSKITQTTI